MEGGQTSAASISFVFWEGGAKTLFIKVSATCDRCIMNSSNLIIYQYVQNFDETDKAKMVKDVNCTEQANLFWWPKVSNVLFDCWDHGHTCTF